MHYTIFCRVARKKYARWCVPVEKHERAPILCVLGIGDLGGTENYLTSQSTRACYMHAYTFELKRSWLLCESTNGENVPRQGSQPSTPAPPPPSTRGEVPSAQQLSKGVRPRCGYVRASPIFLAEKDNEFRISSHVRLPQTNAEGFIPILLSHLLPRMLL